MAPQADASPALAEPAVGSAVASFVTLPPGPFPRRAGCPVQATAVTCICVEKRGVGRPRPELAHCPLVQAAPGVEGIKVPLSHRLLLSPAVSSPCSSEVWTPGSLESPPDWSLVRPVSAPLQPLSQGKDRAHGSGLPCSQCAWAKLPLPVVPSGPRDPEQRDREAEALAVEVLVESSILPAGGVGGVLVGT